MFCHVLCRSILTTFITGGEFQLKTGLESWKNAPVVWCIFRKPWYWLWISTPVVVVIIVAFVAIFVFLLASWCIRAQGLAVSCLIWTFILYIPYALYMSSFSYANGDEPGEFSEGLFIWSSAAITVRPRGHWPQWGSFGTRLLLVWEIPPITNSSNSS